MEPIELIQQKLEFFQSIKQNFDISKLTIKDLASIYHYISIRDRLVIAKDDDLYHFFFINEDKSLTLVKSAVKYDNKVLYVLTNPDYLDYSIPFVYQENSLKGIVTINSIVQKTIDIEPPHLKKVFNASDFLFVSQNNKGLLERKIIDKKGKVYSITDNGRHNIDFRVDVIVLNGLKIMAYYYHNKLVYLKDHLGRGLVTKEDIINYFVANKIDSSLSDIFDENFIEGTMVLEKKK